MKDKKGKKIKVLQIAGGFRKSVNGKVVSGGVPSFLNNYYTKMDTSKIHFDFMAVRNQCFEPYRDEFEKLGAKLYALNIQTDGIKRFITTISKLSKFLKENHYDAVHINMGSFFPVLTCAIAAKKAKVNNIIAHSHSSGKYSKKKRIMANIFAPLLTFFADQYCACSVVAAENLFSKSIIKNKKYQVIRNAIDVEKFTYDKKTRENMRTDLGLTDELVVGHVGRFVEVKNHDFLIDFFGEFNKRVKNSKLLLLGDGELKSTIEDKVKRLGLVEQAIFMGQQKNIHNYYQVMDIFMMPSFLEGFPIVGMEAQSTGLPSYLSSSITKEAKVTDLCRFFNLKDGAENLAKKVSKDIKEFRERKDGSKQVAEQGYGLEENISIFESLYI